LIYIFKAISVEIPEAYLKILTGCSKQKGKRTRTANEFVKRTNLRTQYHLKTHCEFNNDIEQENKIETRIRLKETQSIYRKNNIFNKNHLNIYIFMIKDAGILVHIQKKTISLTVYIIRYIKD
jgi:hypothetical protein